MTEHATPTPPAATPKRPADPYRRPVNAVLKLAGGNLGAPDALPTKISGPGWIAYRYLTSGPGSETIVVQFSIGERFKERFTP